MAKKRKPRPKTYTIPPLEQIAEFYSGGNMKGPITFDYTNSMGTTGMPGSGQIRLNPSLKQGFDMLRRYGPRSQQGMVGGALALSTLIHEALHNRANTPDLRFDEEIAPTDLGWRLIPDAMQRFFGVPIESEWGQKYLDMVMKNLRKP